MQCPGIGVHPGIVSYHSMVFYIYGQFWSVSPNGHKQMAYIIYLMEVWRTRTRFLNGWIFKM
jgi:hypothetical protein